MKFLPFLALILLISGCSGQPEENKTPAATKENSAATEEGKSIFLTRCSSCHMVNKEMTGPALRGVEQRWPDKQKLYSFIRNSVEIIKTDEYARNLWLQFNQTPMTPQPDLTDAQIKQVLDYIRSVTVTP